MFTITDFSLGFLGKRDVYAGYITIKSTNLHTYGLSSHWKHNPTPAAAAFVLTGAAVSSIGEHDGDCVVLLAIDNTPTPPLLMLLLPPLLK